MEYLNWAGDFKLGLVFMTKMSTKCLYGIQFEIVSCKRKVSAYFIMNGLTHAYK